MAYRVPVFSWTERTAALTSHTPPSPLRSGPAIHLLDFRDPNSKQVFDGKGGTITCASLGDEWVIFGGTERGGVGGWDQRMGRQAAWHHGASVQHWEPQWHHEALHAGPVWALNGESGVLFSAGDDGCVRRVGLAGAHAEGALEAALVLRAEAPLRALAWLTSHKQRQAGAGEGLLAAAAESGGVEWAVVAQDT